jgi:hypothetical protein
MEDRGDVSTEAGLLYRRFMDRRALFLVACAAAAGSAGAADPKPTWLEGAIENWNKPAAELPKAPAPAASPDPRCSETARKPASKDDRAVVAAGWTLVGAAQIFGGTRAFLATAGFDGMCRPLDYQGFVFVEGRFVGTLAPAPMRARLDGSLIALRLTSETALSADFARYFEQDPLCCPSRLANVAYRLDATGAAPVLLASSLRDEGALGTPRSPAAPK